MDGAEAALQADNIKVQANQKQAMVGMIFMG
jgi:hypothetical protein